MFSYAPVACRDRLIRLLLLLPVILLPHTAMANTLFDMIKTVGDGAKGSSSSFVTIAQVIGPGALLLPACLASNKSVKNPEQGWPAYCPLWSVPVLPSYRK